MSVDLSIKLPQPIDLKTIESFNGFYKRMSFSGGEVYFDNVPKCGVDVYEDELYFSTNAAFYDYMELAVLVMAKVLNVSKIHDPGSDDEMEVKDEKITELINKLEPILAEHQAKVLAEKKTEEIEKEDYIIDEKYYMPGNMTLNDEFVLKLNTISEELINEGISFTKDVGAIQVKNKGQEWFKVKVFSDFNKGKSIITMRFYEKPIDNLNIFELVHNKLLNTFRKVESKG